MIIIKIRIIGTESLGVRGLCTAVELKDRKIVIDPGISLGHIRNGLMPHPVQIGVGEIIRKKIAEELKDATDVVFSHFHGDHIPLYDANPYQLSLQQTTIKGNIWANKNVDTGLKSQRRQEALVLGLNHDFNLALGKVDKNLFFFPPVPHGEKSSHLGNVTMTKITEGNEVFIHASDIQFLDGEAISKISQQRPDTVIASGPPIYLNDFMNGKTKIAENNILKLSESTGTLIIDHHLMRSLKGTDWLMRDNIICAADYMNMNRHLLEAMRVKLYHDLPVSDDWHLKYSEGKADTSKYMASAGNLYDWFSY